jgi:hypothetical protein
VVDKKNKKPEDLRGFEDFIESLPQDSHFLPRGVGGGVKKEVSFEHFTFLTNDGERLQKLKALLSYKIPFSRKYEQGKKLIEEEVEDIRNLRTELFELDDEANSGYRKSLSEIFTSYFGSK